MTLLCFGFVQTRQFENPHFRQSNYLRPLKSSKSQVPGGLWSRPTDSLWEENGREQEENMLRSLSRSRLSLFQSRSSLQRANVKVQQPSSWGGWVIVGTIIIIILLGHVGWCSSKRLFEGSALVFRLGLEVG